MATRVGGVLLTGGASRRMGTDKASLVVDGETLARRGARVLSAVCDPVIEVGDGLSGLSFVRETPRGSGPVAALVAGVDTLGVVPVVLLACDMPFVEEPLLRLLVEWPGNETVVPVSGGRSQLACARYGAAAINEARAALRDGPAALKRIATSNVEFVAEEVWSRVAPPHALADVDTPDDLLRFGLGERR